MPNSKAFCVSQASHRDNTKDQEHLNEQNVKLALLFVLPWGVSPLFLLDGSIAQVQYQEATPGGSPGFSK